MNHAESRDQVVAAAPDRNRIRTLWLHERGKLEAHLLRLGPHERHLRFGGYLSDEAVRRYCRQVEWWKSHLVGLIDDAGELRAVGEARLRRDGWVREADLAFSVETPFQGEGLGTELFHRLLTYARNRGVARVFITSLPGNARMRRIAKRFGLSIRCDGADDCSGRIELHGPSYASWLSEALDEGTGQLLAGLSRSTPWAVALRQPE